MNRRQHPSASPPSSASSTPTDVHAIIPTAIQRSPKDEEATADDDNDDDDDAEDDEDANDEDDDVAKTT